MHCKKVYTKVYNHNVLNHFWQTTVYDSLIWLPSVFGFFSDSNTEEFHDLITTRKSMNIDFLVHYWFNNRRIVTCSLVEIWQVLHFSIKNYIKQQQQWSLITLCCLHVSLFLGLYTSTCSPQFHSHVQEIITEDEADLLESVWSWWMLLSDRYHTCWWVDVRSVSRMLRLQRRLPASAC